MYLKNKITQKLAKNKNIVFALFLFFALVFSELLYLSNHQNDLVNWILIKSFYKDLDNNKFLKSFSKLTLISNLNIRYRAKKYKELIPEKYILDKDVLKDKFDLQRDFNAFLINYSPRLPKQSFEDTGLSLFYYNFALIAYQNNDFNLSEKFLQTAVYLNPQLSYSHIELANYYLIINDFQKAENAVNYCLNFTNAYEHCLYYKNNAFSKRKIYNLGFIKKAFDQIFAKED